MPGPGRASGTSEPQVAGRSRQRLKIAGLGYAHSRHGLDADLAHLRGTVLVLRQAAFDFAAALPSSHLRGCRFDPSQGDSTMLENAAVAYAAARHGVDADVGMAREAMAMLCQAAVDYAESILRDDPPRRSADPQRQIGNGV